MKRVAIFGPPRSGTSWLAHIFNSHPCVKMRFQPLFSYTHKGALDSKSSSDEINNFFTSILTTNDEFALMQSDVQKSYPRFPKRDHATHLVFKEASYINIIHNLLTKDPNLKIVGIIRNPIATLASWVLAPKEFSKEWSVLDEWKSASKKNQGRLEEYYGYNKWKSAANDFLLFKEQFPKQFKLIKYSNLNNCTKDTVMELFNFCELSVDQQTLSFIKESKARHEIDPYSVYRSQANDNSWHQILPALIPQEIIRDLKGTQLEQFLV